ncbi:MAG: hypothetical protein IAI49_00260 [Candidatus Eremiobacteraeota bacterium]|nr:hypothetical protein [Candidatus Eremiobacteraeota bacterium]
MRRFAYRFEPALAEADLAFRSAARELAAARAVAAGATAVVESLVASGSTLQNVSPQTLWALADLERWSAAQTARERRARAAANEALAAVRSRDVAYESARRRRRGFQRQRERLLAAFRRAEELCEDRDFAEANATRSNGGG